LSLISLLDVSPKILFLVGLGLSLVSLISGVHVYRPIDLWVKRTEMRCVFVVKTEVRVKRANFSVSYKYKKLSYRRETARHTSYFDSQNCEVEFLSHPLGKYRENVDASCVGLRRWKKRGRLSIGDN